MSPTPLFVMGEPARRVIASPNNVILTEGNEVEGRTQGDEAICPFIHQLLDRVPHRYAVGFSSP
jgi:hypothetical protein